MKIRDLPYFSPVKIAEHGLWLYRVPGGYIYECWDMEKFLWSQFVCINSTAEDALIDIIEAWDETLQES